MTSTDVEILTSSFVKTGMVGIENHLDELPDSGDRRLFLLDSIRTAIDATYIENKQLDRMQEIYEACIAEALAIANGDEKLIQYANVTSYNLSANLADCWPDAEEKRFERHFTAGIESARRCLDLRVQLKKPPATMAMAYFILGVHEYSLKQYSKAELAWQSKWENELLDQETTFQDVDLNVLLSRGLIGLAGLSMGAADHSEYNESLRRLEASRTAENSGEVDLFISELTILKRKHGPDAE